MIQSRTSRKITKYKIIYCKISSIYNIYTWFIMILDFVWPGNPIGTSENPKKTTERFQVCWIPHSPAMPQHVPSNSPKARHWRPRVERLRPRCPTQLHLGCWSWASWLATWDSWGNWPTVRYRMGWYTCVYIYTQYNTNIYIRYNIYIVI